MNKRLRELEKSLYPKKQNQFLSIERLSNYKALLEEYFKLCADNKAVQDIIETHQLTKDDIEKYYVMLKEFGFGEWSKGRYILLSSFSQPETFNYIVEAFERGFDPMKIGLVLKAYWKSWIICFYGGKVRLKRGSLKSIIKEADDFSKTLT